jgi:hypothetical protein
MWWCCSDTYGKSFVLYLRAMHMQNICQNKTIRVSMTTIFNQTLRIFS